MKVLGRSRYDLKIAILDACMSRLRPTHLMYRVNVNPSVLNELITDLVKRGLLTELPDTRKNRSFFKTTTAGYNLLVSWRQIVSELGSVSSVG